MKITRKLLAWVLAFAMTLGFVPSLAVSARAEDTSFDQEVLVGVGARTTITDSTGNYEDDVDQSDLDETIAIVTVTGIVNPASKSLSDAVTAIESGKTYVLYNTVAQKLMNNTWADASVGGGGSDGLALSSSKDNFQDADCWTITAVENGYYVQDNAGKYLTIARGKAGVSDDPVVISLAHDGSDWTIGENGEYLNDFGGAHSVAAGWSDINDVNSQWYLYEVITTPGNEVTEITFTGIAEGVTYVQVGQTVYKITVRESDDGHTYDNGFCVDTGCNAYQPALLNAEGVYQISNGGQLYWFAALVNGDTDAVPGIVQDADANAVLTCDITVNRQVLDNGTLVSNSDALRQWVPIGRFVKYNNYVSYSGTFDGQGNTISGLYLSDETKERVALFGVVEGGAQIKNVGLSDTYFSGKQFVGGIVAEGYSSADQDPMFISNCWTENSVISAEVYYVGGIAGHIARYAQITDCSNGAAVNGGDMAGGIIGYCGDAATITGCSNEGTVSGGAGVGGIAGANVGGNFVKNMSRCANTGDVSGATEVGGVVGQNSSSVEDSYNRGDVTGTGANVGGVVGCNMNKGAKVADCYNTDDVAAPVIGGSSNAPADAVDNCYYLATSEVDDLDGTTAKTADVFASGEVAWLLNHETDEGNLVWFQTIGTQETPEFEGKVVHNEGEIYYNDDDSVADEVIRVAGANRWATALLVADEMKAALGDEKFDAIIIASGNDFADALAGSYLATVKNAPILLSYGGDNEKYAYLDNDNINYVKENLAEDGVVYILGGEKAVPTLYEDGLEGYDVVRLGGANRFETNILILEEAGIADGAEVLVCTSANFADSLSASATGKPILLVWNDSGALYGSQPEFLSELKEKGCTFTILGGENAVSAKLADEVAKYGEVDRLAGNTRMETSVLVAEKYFDAPETAVLAYAWNYPDGLCGGSLAYSLHAPLILTMPKYEAAAVEYAAENDITTGYVLGGDGLIGDAEVRAIFAMDAAVEIIVK